LKAALLAYLIFISLNGWSQTFPVKGQYPSTAYPVCGADTIRQAAVPLGLTTTIPVPNCDGYPDVNPFYYAFTCYGAGYLGFLITPNDPGDNYDWMLFDYTGALPSIIYKDSTLIVSANRSAKPGQTGAQTGGISHGECSSTAAESISTFTKMPLLIKGHQYLLLVSHPGDSQSGYSLVFTGGTAVINDPALPEILSVVVSCDKKMLTVGITKFVRCNSLAADGSDFIIKNYAGTINQAIGLNCSPQFDYDYLELLLSDPLPAGKYSLVLQNGSDGNTLTEDCGSQALVGNKMDFSVSEIIPGLDSIVPPVCEPNILHLIFSGPIRCSTIAEDGSDFEITGPSPVGIAKAEAICSGDLTNAIDITLTAPIIADGAYQIKMRNGSDGNTLINDCDTPVPPGAFLSFDIKGAASANFDFSVGYGCKVDTINLNYLPANGVNQWIWNMDSSVISTLQSPVIHETVFGSKNIQHIVSNGECSDTVIKTVNLDNTLKAAFQSPVEVCPKSIISFANTSIGNIISYNWDFGDGSASESQTPPDHLYPDTREGKTYAVRLTVQNNMGCLDTAVAQITKMQSCAIGVPNAFTPNGDGKNDYLYPLNAFSVTNLEFQVFNRLGQLVFETRDWTKKWDGTINGKLQQTGTYIWMLRYTDASGRNFSLRGTSVLIR
jgi:gliding motility-associated-like protein